MKIEFKKLNEIEQGEIMALMNNALVRRQMPLLGENFTPEDCEEFLAAKQAMWEEFGYGPWAFVVDGRFAGWGGLQPENGEADLGLVLHPDYWGLGRVLYQRILDQAFVEMGLETVTVLLPPSRKRVRGLLRLGFKRDGELIIEGERFLRYRLNRDRDRPTPGEDLPKPSHCRKPIVDRTVAGERSSVPGKITSAELISKTERLLAQELPAPARVRLLRDVLSVSPDDPRLRAQLVDLEKCQQVRTLLQEQRGDGSWGAFHSRSTTNRQKTASTEVGVERALNLGLDDSHPALQKAKRYLLGILQGKTPFPDHQEKNDRWLTGMRLFTASTLSLLDPAHNELDPERELWRQIASRTFQSGSYSVQDEIEAHRELTGASVKDSYLVINNRYALNILGSKKDLLPPGIEKALTCWILENPAGIGYLGVPLQKKAPLGYPGPLDRWFASLELLLRLFPRSARMLRTQLDWIWDTQGADGLWDFGPRSHGSTFLPLADSWRSSRNRLLDWSARVLILLAAAASG